MSADLARRGDNLVRREGVEGALTRLYDAGVYVSLDEFKGRRPVRRGSLELATTSRDFDNPLGAAHISAQSGGSRSGGTRLQIDLAHNARSAVYDYLLFETQDALDRPYVIWQPTRACGCALHALGFERHLHTIRSHEKLTSEGMNFLGHDLIRLIEEVLPGWFGGGPTDYQLVEDEDERGLPMVQLVASPRLGLLPEAKIVGAVIAYLNASQGGGLYGERWREAGALRVVRREPYTTSASKILALHTKKAKNERPPSDREAKRRA